MSEAEPIVEPMVPPPELTHELVSPPDSPSPVCIYLGMMGLLCTYSALQTTPRLSPSHEYLVILDVGLVIIETSSELIIVRSAGASKVTRRVGRS